MLEYPSINNSSKAPRKEGIAFRKYDGSNIRVKWTPKQSFCLFGSRTQLLDETHPHLAEVVSVFKSSHADTFDKYFRSEKDFRHEKEIIVFGEFFGPNSFAGLHEPSDAKVIKIFDVMLARKPNSVFLLPQDFLKRFDGMPNIAESVYRGNLNESFIEDVRQGKFYPEDEGVIFKGTEKSGAYRGGVWSCKIKTYKYFERLKNRYGDDWEKYAE